MEKLEGINENRARYGITHLFVLPAIVKALAVIPPINHNKLLERIQKNFSLIRLFCKMTAAKGWL